MSRHLLGRLLILAFSLTAFAVGACDCDGTDIGRLAEPEIELLDEGGNSHKTADPWLVLAFGDIDVNQTAVRTLKVKNVGTGLLEPSAVCLLDAVDVAAATAATPDGEGSYCQRFGLATAATPYTFTDIVGEQIGEGLELEVDISFTPRDAGPKPLFLRIESNADDEPAVAVQLTGRGSGGALCSEDAQLDFGDVVIGDTVTKTVTLESCGDRAVSIDSYTLLQNPDDAFTVTYQGGAVTAGLPIGPLEEGDTVVLEVTFSPPEARVYRDTLAGIAQLTTAAPFAAEYTLVFGGVGKTPPE